MASSHFIDPNLTEAIRAASSEQLKLVLNGVLQIHPETASTASSLLYSFESSGTISQHLPLISDSSVRSPKKRTWFETCVQCKREYDVADNGSKACSWHQGTKLPNRLLSKIPLQGSKTDEL